MSFIPKSLSCFSALNYSIAGLSTHLMKDQGPRSSSILCELTCKLHSLIMFLLGTNDAYMKIGYSIWWSCEQSSTAFTGY